MGLFKDCGCGCKGQKQQQKFMASLLGALIFFVIASPEAFRLVRGIAGKWVATPNGSPSPAGLLLHSIVFLLIVWATMNVKKEFMEGEEAPEEEEPVAEEEEEPATEEEPVVEEKPAAEEKPVAVAEEKQKPVAAAEEKPVVAVAEEVESMPVDGSSLTMSSPDGEIIDSCTLKSGKKLVISN